MLARKYVILVLLPLLVLFSACQQAPVPKPQGYFRIALPQPDYQRARLASYPYSFDISQLAMLQPREEEGEKYWVDVQYPTLNATIHCSYKPIQGNFRTLSDDAQRFVYKHAGQADAIEEQAYLNDEERVYGVFYTLEGNTASPYQFYVTDREQHFLRCALYFNCIPNQDSLQPVINYMQQDLIHLIETFQWQ